MDCARFKSSESQAVWSDTKLETVREETGQSLSELVKKKIGSDCLVVLITRRLTRQIKQQAEFLLEQKLHYFSIRRIRRKSRTSFFRANSCSQIRKT